MPVSTTCYAGFTQQTKLQDQMFQVFVNTCHRQTSQLQETCLLSRSRGSGREEPHLTALPEELTAFIPMPFLPVVALQNITCLSPGVEAKGQAGNAD